MKNVKIYICPHCGNIVEMIHDAGVNPVCCGQKKDELVAGSVEHPMADEHWIEWVEL